MRESTIERGFCEAIERLGFLCEKFKSPGRRNVPDRMVSLPGPTTVFVEFKAPGEPLRSGQERDHNRRRSLGFRVYVVDSPASRQELLYEIRRHVLTHARTVLQ